MWKHNIRDASAAIENLLLVAWNQGLGSCCMTGPLRSRGEDVARFLNIPEGREIVALVTLGYPAYTPKSPPKGDLASKVNWLWSGQDPA